MNTEKNITFIVVMIIFAIVIVFAIINIIKFSKLSKEEKLKILKTYLKGLVSLAEQEIIGTKRGEERMAMVEEYFNKKAPFIYKMILSVLGKDNLKEIIEDALKEVKESFNK